MSIKLSSLFSRYVWVFFMVILDVTIVNVALPTIAYDKEISKTKS
jgi:hypothetical protein